MMINLDKLDSQFDIKSKADRILKILIDYQKAIVLVLFILSLLTAGLMFKDNRSKQRDMRAKLSQEQVKLEVIKAREAAIQDLNNFKASLPMQLNEVELIGQVSNDANLYHVTIPSLNPSNSRDMGLYDQIDVSFTGVADNFKDAMLFLRNMEKANPPLRVNTWTGHEEEDGKISFDIEISAVHIHS